MLLPDGMKPIEEIRKGDWVWSVAPETGDPELKQVEDVFVNETDEIVHVRYGDTEIDATPNHPFYIPDRGWVSAVNLRAGDRLQLVNGEYVTVEQVQHEILESPVTVYNFRVADNHTYYVGGTYAVLVHNMSCGLKTGKPSLPDGVTRLRKDIRKVNSQEFKDTIRSMGKNFRSSEWKYIMETWVTDTGKRIERHYWHNSKTGESFFHL